MVAKFDSTNVAFRIDKSYQFLRETSDIEEHPSYQTQREDDRKGKCLVEF